MNVVYSPFEILYLAIVIDSLSYSLGAILYGSPIPVRAVKDMGYKMILNSLYVAVLSNIFGFIISLVNQLQTVLGVSWNVFYLDIGLLQVQMVTALNMAKIIYVVIATILYYSRISTILSSFITPILQYISFLTDLLILLNFYMNLGAFIQTSYMLLIAIGVLLMSLPFQMGKGIGSLLIAFTIVFYIGFPLLPILISSTSPLQSQNLIFQDIALQTEEFFGDIPALSYSFIIVPLTYIGVLAGFSIVLESFIGGYAGKLPIPIEI
ncbi:DNA import protein CedA [Sulfolobus tengchongensis]|uniref:DNA import protein CedA n=1 Tax=Sulfolobus tengchongensis TaxID=207809 RepID=A0AAX4KYE0_9CREN